jgi:hypothetical protein
MSWTFDFSRLDTNPVSQIRLEIGDTDPRDPKLQDEEITWALSQERNLWAAAARCCELIARVRLSKADIRLGRSMQVQYSRTAQQYFEMAKSLRAKAMGTVVPYAGGVNVADKLSIMGNDALVAPAFTRTMQENPWTGGYTSDSLGPAVSENPVDEDI